MLSPQTMLPLGGRKEVPLTEAAFGIVGLETAFALGLTVLVKRAPDTFSVY